MTSFATNNTGQPLSIKAADLANRHLLIVGQTGSGKTTSTLALIHQLQTANHTTIVLDPTGEYTHLPNSITYRLGQNAYLETGQLTTSEFIESLQVPVSPLLQSKLKQAINALRIQQNLKQVARPYVKLNVPIRRYQQQLSQLGDWAQSFSPQLLAQQLIEEFIIPSADHHANYQLLGQQYERAAINHEWDSLAQIRQQLVSHYFQTIFDPVPHPGIIKTELNFVLKMFLDQRSSHRILVIDLTQLKEFESSQQVIISLLLKNLLAYRLHSSHHFPVEIVLDEAHRYLPRDEAALADNGIFQVLREGRKVGISMVLTTQSPLDLPAKLRSQFAHLLIHYLASPEELTSLSLQHPITSTMLSQLTVGHAILSLPSQQPQVIKINPVKNN